MQFNFVLNECYTSRENNEVKAMPAYDKKLTNCSKLTAQQQDGILIMPPESECHLTQQTDCHRLQYEVRRST